jgi:hypothetical protein
VPEKLLIIFVVQNDTNENTAYNCDTESMGRAVRNKAMLRTSKTTKLF